MNGWYTFWLANFVVAGSAFAVITVIVVVRGLADLRDMFANLRDARPADAGAGQSGRPPEAMRRTDERPR